MTSPPAELSGSSYAYEYRELGRFVDASSTPGNLLRYAKESRGLFGALAENWSDQLHQEWLLREYLGLKLFIASTILLGSAEHTARRNVVAAVPYLTYYALFNSMRGALLLSPRQRWKVADTIAVTHDKARTAFEQELSLLMSTQERGKAADLIRKAKAGREFLSYRFPASGPGGLGEYRVHLDVTEQLCRVAAEIAYFNSACLNAAVESEVERGKIPSRFSADPTDMREAYSYELRAKHDEPVPYIFDNTDWALISKVAMRWSRPAPLTWMVGDGGIEDLFGAWKSSLDDDEVYDPDEDWDRLLSL